MFRVDLQLYWQNGLGMCISLNLANVFRAVISCDTGPLDIGPKINVHRTFRRPLGLLPDVLYMFTLCLASRGCGQLLLLVIETDENVRSYQISSVFLPHFLIIKSKKGTKALSNLQSNENCEISKVLPYQSK